MANVGWQDGPPGPILVGRDALQQTLRAMLAKARTGSLQVTLLAGEPGIGKTRLLDALAEEATRDAIPVLRGGASEAVGMPPYLPFLEALGAHIRQSAPDALRAQVGDSASVLAMIFPELVARLGALPPSPPLPAEQAQLRLYEAVGHFLATIAAPQGLLLALDDLQWADRATLDLLVHVAQRHPDARLLVLGAYRAGEVAAHESFQRATANLNRLRLLTTLPLAPLPAPTMYDLAARLLAAPVSSALRERLACQSEGNPFFAEELLRDWLESGAIERGVEGWTVTGVPASTLPSSIVATVHQRLARLAPSVVDDLRAAAIIGRAVDPFFLAEVTAQPVEEVEERLLVAVQAHLLRATPEGSYAFAHDKVRETLYLGVSPIRRQGLHGRVGSALEGRAVRGEPSRPDDLAFHFTRSGDRARAARYALQAAKQAAAAYAYAEALDHYRSAHALLPPDDERRGETAMAAGEVALLAGAEREAVALFEEARDLWVARGDKVGAARAAHLVGRAWWRMEALPEAEAAFQRALALLEQQDTVGEVAVRVDLGTMLGVSLHRLDEGLRHAERALALAQHLEDDRLVVMAGRTVGFLHVRRNELPRGIALLEQALALAIALDDPIEGAECCATLTIPYAWAGEVTKFAAIFPRWLLFAQRCHDPYQLRHIYTQLAQYYAFQGRWEEAEAEMARAQAVIEQMASPEPRAFHQLARGFIDMARGRYKSAARTLAAGLEILRPLGPNSLVWYLGIVACNDVLRGEPMAALPYVAEVEALLEQFPADAMLTAEPRTQLAFVALALQDEARLARLEPLLQPFQGQFHDFIVDRLLGMMATRAGRWEEAERLLSAAERLARQGCYLELAFTLEAQADLALAWGGAEPIPRARARLAEAQRVAADYGNPTEAARLGARLAALDAPAPRDERRLPAGLSVREAEVLALVASGQSNRAIAQALHLSEKTVANHLTHIFNKLAVDNRAAAAAFAVRHGLA